jgi:hypothetical protein
MAVVGCEVEKRVNVMSSMIWRRCMEQTVASTRLPTDSRLRHVRVRISAEGGGGDDERHR